MAVMPVYSKWIPTATSNQALVKKHMHAKGHSPLASVSTLPAHIVHLVMAAQPLVLLVMLQLSCATSIGHLVSYESSDSVTAAW